MTKVGGMFRDFPAQNHTVPMFRDFFEKGHPFQRHTPVHPPPPLPREYINDFDKIILLPQAL